jgi:hypothetical protein
VSVPWGGGWARSPPQRVTASVTRLYKEGSRVSRRVCKGCSGTARVEVRQLRIYSHAKQWKFRLVLCETCFGAMFDLIFAGSDGFTEGLWSPLPGTMEDGVWTRR